ncbi:MAG: hypothetical protein V3S41_07685 [Spirochaetia bacterium]
MIGEPARHTLDLSRREMLSLYIVLTKYESELDNTQQGVLGRLCDQVYELLSVEQIEHIDSFYESL